MYGDEHSNYKNIDFRCDSMFCYINQYEVSEDVEHFLIMERYKLLNQKVIVYRDLIRKINIDNGYETVF